MKRAGAYIEAKSVMAGYIKASSNDVASSGGVRYENLVTRLSSAVIYTNVCIYIQRWGEIF